MNQPPLPDLICHHLNLQDLIYFWPVCKNTYSLYLNPATWSHLLKRDYNIPLAINPKETYLRSIFEQASEKLRNLAEDGFRDSGYYCSIYNMSNSQIIKLYQLSLSALNRDDCQSNILGISVGEQFYRLLQKLAIKHQHCIIQACLLFITSKDIHLNNTEFIRMIQ